MQWMTFGNNLVIDGIFVISQDDVWALGILLLELVLVWIKVSRIYHLMIMVVLSYFYYYDYYDYYDYYWYLYIFIYHFISNYYDDDCYSYSIFDHD